LGPNRIGRRRLLALLAAPLVSRTAFGQEIRARQNIDYRLIPRQPIETGDQIEVIDFFWYGCPYCNELQPLLEEWIKHKPDDVAIRRIPAVRRDTWAPHARIYYTLQQLGELERLHQAVYHGYHVDLLHMSKADVMAQWAVRNGIDRKRWTDAYFSPESDAGVERALEATKRYQIQGTPSLVVDGRYLTSSSMTPTMRDVIRVLDDLIRLARRDRGQ